MSLEAIEVFNANGDFDLINHQTESEVLKHIDRIRSELEEKENKKELEDLDCINITIPIEAAEQSLKVINNTKEYRPRLSNRAYGW